MTPDQKSELIKMLISKFPMYGEVDTVSMAFTKTNLHNGYLTELMESFDNAKHKDEAINSLISEGFIINRDDISTQTQKIRQLTDKGRKLKEMGSIEIYQKEQDKKKKDATDTAEREAKADQRDVYHFWVTVLIGISTAITAIYYGIEIYKHFSKAPIKY